MKYFRFTEDISSKLSKEIILWCKWYEIKITLKLVKSKCIKCFMLKINQKLCLKPCSRYENHHVRLTKHIMKRIKLYLTVRVPFMSIIVSKMIETDPGRYVYSLSGFTKVSIESIYRPFYICISYCTKSTIPLDAFHVVFLICVS